MFSAYSVGIAIVSNGFIEEERGCSENPVAVHEERHPMAIEDLDVLSRSLERRIRAWMALW